MPLPVSLFGIPHFLTTSSIVEFFLKDAKQATWPRRFGNIEYFELLWHRLIVKGVMWRVASLGNCFLGRELEAGR
jgi:hypothetical protein